MSTGRKSAFPVVLLAAVLALLPALVQAEQARRGDPSFLAAGTRQAGEPAGDRVGEEAGFLSALWQALAGFWSKNGMSIDPNGGPHAAPPSPGTAALDGGAAAISAKEGMSIDPNGSHAAPAPRGRGAFARGAAPRCQ